MTSVNIIVSGLVGLPARTMAGDTADFRRLHCLDADHNAGITADGESGRKPIFMAGRSCCLGMMVQMQMLLAGNFTGHMAGALLIGGAYGIAQFYRYAAADALPEQKKSVAVSLVLAGGLIAAFAGATIVNMSLGWFAGRSMPHAFWRQAKQPPTLLLLAG